MKNPENSGLSTFYNENGQSGMVDLIKFLLMPFVFFSLLGAPIPGIVGNYVNAISGFASLAFFTLCGFFVLIPEDERRLRKITRALWRSLVGFLLIFVCYVAINLFYLQYNNGLSQLIGPEVLRLRTPFNFLVLNVWPLPVGSSIWFIQSLLHAYLFFFIVEKIKLSKTWFYLTVLVLLLAFMLYSGEFSGLANFSLLGYSYIPGGAITKAIPFMIIGMFLRRGVDRLAKIPRFVYLISFFAGIACSVAELYLLSKAGKLIYTGNMIGYAIMAISIVCFAVTSPELDEDSFFGNHGRSYARRMYAFCQPCAFFLWFLFVLLDRLAIWLRISQYQSLICFAICFGLAVLIGWIRYKISTLRERF